MKRPAISVVIPAYNCESYIERCINSCLAQDILAAYEVIVCNDNSSDATGDILNELFGDDDCIRILSNDVNQGVGACRNHCIRHARGRYIFLLDGDDYIHPKTLRLLHDSIEMIPSASIVYCDYIYVDDNEQKSGPVSAAHTPIACGQLIKKLVFLQHGLYRELRLGEEIEFKARMEKQDVSMLHLPLPLYRYRQHSLSITAEFSNARHYDAI